LCTSESIAIRQIEITTENISFLYFEYSNYSQIAILVTLLSKACTGIYGLNTGIVGSTPTLIMNIFFCSLLVLNRLASVFYCMPLDDGRMTETCSGNDIGGGEEELLRRRTITCLMNAEILWLADIRPRISRSSTEILE
jgi:hypothetical protein